MTQYLISMYQPDGEPPPPEFLVPIMEKLGAINEDMKAVGEFVFTDGLSDPSTATVVTWKDGESLMTDGPFIESKEHLGGFWIVDCPDLDVALSWADKIVSVTQLPLEVRPFANHGQN
ncbi:MAG: hypothetical protein JWR83_1926 [Aeromicrobium sp.]|nr:hypothetical protein [Aeromicrobium sp.]